MSIQYSSLCIDSGGGFVLSSNQKRKKKKNRKKQLKSRKFDDKAKRILLLSSLVVDIVTLCRSGCICNICMLAYTAYNIEYSIPPWLWLKRNNILRSHIGTHHTINGARFSHIHSFSCYKHVMHTYIRKRNRDTHTM